MKRDVSIAIINMMCYDGAAHSMKPSINNAIKKKLSFKEFIDLSEVDIFIVPGDLVQFSSTAEETPHPIIYQHVMEKSDGGYEFATDYISIYLVKNSDIFMFLGPFENTYGQAYAFYSMPNNRKVGVSKKYMSYMSDTYTNEKFYIRKL